MLTQYFYDLGHRRTSTIDPNEHVTTNQYDGAGNVTGIVDARAN